MDQSGTAHSGGGAGGGKVKVHNLSITKPDRASPTLAKFCCNGKHFKQATLLLRKAAGDKPLEYGKIVMNDGLIASVSFQGVDGDGLSSETIHLNFASFSMEYTPQSASGTAGGAIPMQWNIARNAES
jgi:type VI secretion system secreted protein Hcp